LAPNRLANNVCLFNQELIPVTLGERRMNAGVLRRIVIGFGCAGFVVCPASAQEPLSGYNANISESSISGISSGAFMAVQFGTAWSSVIKGVGVVAGGPFWCAKADADDFINGYTLPMMNATGPA
jgi:poly(3-hydroxybutyrate) depolymerase